MSELEGIQVVSRVRAAMERKMQFGKTTREKGRESCDTSHYLQPRRCLTDRPLRKRRTFGGDVCVTERERGRRFYWFYPFPLCPVFARISVLGLLNYRDYHVTLPKVYPQRTCYTSRIV